MSWPRHTYSSRSGTDSASINGEMPIAQILGYLTKHGCKNVSPYLDQQTFSVVPVSTGGAGNIYRGRLTDETGVAVKCLRLRVGSSDESKKDLRRAAHELYVWSKCQHPNVLELTGVAVFHAHIAMVSPWMRKGTVTWFASQNPLVDRYTLCAQIGEGVAYLHNNNVVHGDLKGANILVSNDGTPKITDFGTAIMSKYTLNFEKTTGIPGLTLRWAAPELVKGESGPTTQADVYALGMTYLEVVTGSAPYHKIGEHAIMWKIAHGTLPTRPLEQMPIGIPRHDQMWLLLEACWAYYPQTRPTSSQIIDHMKLIAPREPNYESLPNVLSFLSALGYRNFTDTIAASIVTPTPVDFFSSHDRFEAITHDFIDGALVYSFSCPNDSYYKDQWKANRESVRAVYLWSKCRHPNVLQPFGFAEYCGRLVEIIPPTTQDTKSFLRSNPNTDRVRHLVDAVAYLHSQGVVQGNIVISHVMVSDGGKAALVCANNTVLESGGALFRRDPLIEPYFRDEFDAPERFSYQLIPTREADVWSLGSTMAMIVTGCYPRQLGIESTPDYTTPEQPNVNALRSPRGERFWALVRACRRIKPEDRPTATRVLEELKSIADMPSNQDQSEGWKL